MLLKIVYRKSMCQHMNPFESLLWPECFKFLLEISNPYDVITITFVHRNLKKKKDKPGRQTRQRKGTCKVCWALHNFHFVTDIRYCKVRSDGQSASITCANWHLLFCAFIHGKSE